MLRSNVHRPVLYWAGGQPSLRLRLHHNLPGLVHHTALTGVYRGYLLTKRLLWAESLSAALSSPHGRQCQLQPCPAAPSDCSLHVQASIVFKLLADASPSMRTAAAALAAGLLEARGAEILVRPGCW